MIDLPWIWRYYTRKRVLLWHVLLAALSVALTFVPLFHVLGYEFCFALALGASLAALHLASVAVVLARAAREGLALSVDGIGRGYAWLLVRTVLCNLSLLALPLGIIAVAAIWIKNCDFLGGLQFFAMLPVLSVIVASLVGALCALIIRRPGRATLAASCVFVSSLLLGFYRFYATPAVFAYDPFAGYFPGALYDQEVSIQPAFLWARALHLCAVLGLACLGALFYSPAELRLRWRALRVAVGPTLVGLLLLGAAALLFHFRAPLGFAIDGAYVATALGGVRQTPHFTIHYPRELAPIEVDLLADEHEFRYAQLKTTLATTGPAHITSFIFVSAEQKRALMGAGHTFIAKPWRNEVYLQHEAFPHPVLKHELAHVFAREFGDAMFGVSVRWRGRPMPHPAFNVGLIEGLAVAADFHAYGEATPHQLAAAMVRLGLAPPPEQLFGYGFFGSASSRGYILAGSMCRFLLERYGVHKLKAAYQNGGDFAEAYGQPLSALVDEYLRFIRTVQVPKEELDLAAEQFRRPAIIHQVCSHAIANLIEQSETLVAGHELPRARALLEQVCRFELDEPSHLLRWARIELASRRTDEALTLGKRAVAHPSASQPLRREALELCGDVYFGRGELPQAKATYAEAGALAAPPFARRMLYLKQWALRQPNEIRATVRDYLLAVPFSRPTPRLDIHRAHRLEQLMPRAGLGAFLVGKQLASQEEGCPAAIAEFQRAIERGLPNDDFVVEATMGLGRCQLIARDVVGAARAFESVVARNNLAPGLVLAAKDYLDRVRFVERLNATRGAQAIAPSRGPSR